MLVKQVENVLDLLEFFAAEGKPASLAEVSLHFGWPRSSAFNLLSTLVARGYLFELGGRGKFYPTPRWLTLAQSLSAAEPVPADLLALARTLNARTQETVCIGAASTGSLIYLEVVLSSERVRYAGEVGQRIPLHATAAGMAVLSQWPAAQRLAHLRKVEFERYGPGTPMGVEAVETEIRTSLQRGWFKSASNYSVDLGAVALPLPLQGRIFAVTVAGPLGRLADRMPRLAATLHAAIAEHLGEDYLTRSIKGLTTPPHPETPA